MQIISYPVNGSTSNTERVFLYKDSGAAVGTEGDPFTGLAFDDAGLIISTIADTEATPTVYTSAGNTIETIATLGTYVQPTAEKCRVKLIDNTNNPGAIELQFDDTRYAETNAKYLDIFITGVTDLAAYSGRIYLDGIDKAGIRSAIGLATANMDAQLSSIAAVVAGIASVGALTSDLTDLINTIGTPAGADLVADIAALNNLSAADILTTALVESYAANGVAPTLSQLLFLVQQLLSNFKIVGTLLTVSKLNVVAIAATATLNDASNPTDVSRTT